MTSDLPDAADFDATLLRNLSEELADLSQTVFELHWRVEIDRDETDPVRRAEKARRALRLWVDLAESGVDLNLDQLHAHLVAIAAGGKPAVDDLPLEQEAAAA